MCREYGFRYRAYHAAQLLGLTGWVRNEYDGSVTIEVQGEDHAINTMLEMIEKSRYIEIDHLYSAELSLDPHERSFEIRD
jgi:acylphosphatase